MNELQNTWALVLAAGEGSRLRRLTTISDGVAVPKQFCSLQGGLSLLDEAIERASSISAREHICTIVAQQHRRWWEGSLQRLPPSNVIVQPENRGTANGILLPLLHVMERDPNAHVVLLPADHYVREEGLLSHSLQRAVQRLALRRREIVLLGLEPEEADPELGYIVPGERDGYGVRTVRRFVEKPSRKIAEELIVDGALWNVFIVAARADALLALFLSRFPEIVGEMNAAIGCDAASETVARLYRTLPNLDFSRHILPGAESWLRVLPAPACGWSDLGTPERVARTLRRTSANRLDETGFSLSGHLNLARQHFLLEAAL